MAGVVALSAYGAEQQASTDEDWAAYIQSHDTVRTANNVADGLYGVGAIALGVGAYLFFRAPSMVTVGAGAGRGQASVVVGGHF